MLLQGWASGYGLQEHLRQSKKRGKNRDGVEVQQEIMHIGIGVWRSQEVSYYYVGQQFGLSEKKQVRWRGLTSDSCVIDRS